MQNTSPEGLLFDRVLLEPVHGMSSRRITSASLTSEGKAAENHAFKDGMTTLLPNDSRQYLFLLSPTPSPDASADIGSLSVFPPAFVGGTVLPLGRLDVAWRSGRYHDPGRLQTSTLNRRVPVTPIAPKPGLAPTRTSSAIPPSPAGPSRVLTSPTPPPLPGKEEDARWEFDLSALSLARDGVSVDSEIEGTLRLGIRRAKDGTGHANASANTEDEESGDGQKPGPVHLAIQYLAQPPTTSLPNGTPSTTISPPSRSNTPQPPSFSPGTSSSRAHTPVVDQLRQATTSHITSPTNQLLTAAPPAPSTSFPPPPYLSKSPAPLSKTTASGPAGEAYPLGASMFTLPPPEWKLVREQHETTYTDAGEDERPKRWEAVWEFPLRWLALTEGLAPLGGLRALVLDDPTGLQGYVGMEWDSLGDIYITS